MKPHALRRILWFGSIGCLVAAGAAGAHFMLNVRPATAATLARKPKVIEKKWKAIASDYNKDRQVKVKWTHPAPVDDKTLHRWLLRKDYIGLSVEHFALVGPMPPPEKIASTETISTLPPAPTGLEALGAPSMTIYRAPDRHSVLFRFESGEVETFGVGEFIKEAKTGEDRFKFLDLRRGKLSETYDLVYGVFDREGQQEGDTPSTLFIDNRNEGSPGDVLRRATRAKPLTTTPKPGAGTAEGSAAEGAEITGDAAAETAIAALASAEATPIEDLTIEDLSPVIIRHSDTQKAIVFDQNTFNWLSRRSGTAVADTVKTRVASDPRTGQPTGLQITGFGEDAPADAFDVRRGDILKSINDRPVRSREDAIAIANTLSEGQLVKVVLERNRKEITYMVDPQDPKNRRRMRYFDNVN